MPLRRLIIRLLLCATFALASSYVQAMSLVDDIHSNITVHVAKAKLPPCHQTMKHGKYDDGGHHNGCCSNFACAVGLIVDNELNVLPKARFVHDLEYGITMRSSVVPPLNPPPKTI